MASELKPCPFCGKTPVMDKGHSFFQVMCNNHDCWIMPRTDLYTKEETAIEAWNGRAEDG